MKLLLTSAGITNKTIAQALQNLVEQPFENLSVAFIPTAANTFAEDKGWLLEEMNQVYTLGWRKFDIVDISAFSSDIVLDRLQVTDVVVVGGGDTYPLMEEIQKKNLENVFGDFAQEKVYVGISAGSMITSGKMTFKEDAEMYQEGVLGEDITHGLGLVEFHIKPHFHGVHFPRVTEENVRKVQQMTGETAYLIDDNTAVVVVDQNVSVVSEGQWKKIE